MIRYTRAWLAHEQQQHDQRREAVKEIDVDAAVLEASDQRRYALVQPRHRQVKPIPQPVLGDGVIDRPGIERGRHFPSDAEERLEDLLDRLTEAFGCVLHAGSLLRIAAIPWRRSP